MIPLTDSKLAVREFNDGTDFLQLEIVGEVLFLSAIRTEPKEEKLCLTVYYHHVNEYNFALCLLSIFSS